MNSCTHCQLCLNGDVLCTTEKVVTFCFHFVKQNDNVILSNTVNVIASATFMHGQDWLQPSVITVSLVVTALTLNSSSPR